jgi:hypothetical protein
LAVFLTHLPADWCKEAFAHWFAPCDAEDRPTVRWRLAALLLDQSVHLVLLTMIVVYLPAWDVAMAPGLGADFFGDLWPKLLALTAGAVLSVFAGNVVIGLAVESLLAEMRQPKMHGEVDGQRRGFENGGKYIGQLERALILLFVLAGQPQGVGFLVAAKSVFRFGDLKEHRDRMEAEYIIIGTMLSFGWGLAVALLTQRVLQGQ